MLGIITNRHIVLSFLAAVMAAMLGAAGCSQSAPALQPQAPQPQAPAPQYRLTATVQDLMQGLIDPSADALWDSVAYIANASGIEDRQPRTPEQWQAVRTSAVNLIEAANLLSMPGRIVADDPAGNPPSLKPGEHKPAEIQQRIDASHEAFVQFARGLQAATLQALTAIDAKNAQGLMDAGATIDEACEVCHVTYWYPNQRRP